MPVSKPNVVFWLVHTTSKSKSSNLSPSTFRHVASTVLAMKSRRRQKVDLDFYADVDGTVTEYPTTAGCSLYYYTNE